MTSLTETELRSSPFNDDDLFSINKRREHLTAIIHEPFGPKKDSKPRETKQMAREQLARMTVVFRWYMNQYQDRIDENTGVSMTADVLEAGLSVSEWVRGSFAGPVFCYPLRAEMEQEVHEIVQGLHTSTEDDIIEMWQDNDRGDWGRMLREGRQPAREFDPPLLATLSKSRSEDNLIYLRRGAVVPRRPARMRRLLTSKEDELDREWPLVLGYIDSNRRIPYKAVGLSRSGSDSSS